MIAREREVLDYILRDQDNQNIASAMSLAPSTVKVHVHNILHEPSDAGHGRRHHQDGHERGAAPAACRGALRQLDIRSHTAPVVDDTERYHQTAEDLLVYARRHSLTAREREVLDYILAGQTLALHLVAGTQVVDAAIEEDPEHEAGAAIIEAEAQHLVLA